ncbi:chemotaxis protein CheB [Solidesulfovibrio magneticus]|uniref:Chemotaxis CheB/CheR fusion protein n=1 Tax=Solidesulfovibrio magneticus (strain ATCC 700980 / DSM 13731 / RS-1) TaxID=573370 RepID=C4XM23_SOLM1|nr:chemotaxis protein CheB [Solidesulfovibrio magneticus]BAH77151.1 putative chemotaxis CheB/CheR fusion protein [Solidesulfovibrio magneticus RS-1]
MPTPSKDSTLNDNNATNTINHPGGPPERKQKNEITDNLHIVGVGASAGGLEALEFFFNQMPPKNGLAFVVIQHLSPDFKSLMDEILSRQTSMAIHRVEDGMELLPDSIYLIPPKKEMTVRKGKLFLFDKEPSRPLEMPIDIFFRSMAKESGERAIGVILSGTGSDGSRGIGAIHEAGGLVLVQSPDTAQFDGMPRSAIDTGMVNFILSPKEMPEVILQYLNDPQAFRRSEQQTLLDGQAIDDESSMALALLKRHYGIDFAYYKPTTVGRRLSRRMTMRQMSRLSDYLDFLSTNVEELNDLYKDLLIGVTSFFRDPEAFSKMEREIIPSIFESASENEEIRAWIAGCATGEEVYSLGILLYEEARRRQFKKKITIFATDVHRESLEFASQGLYDLNRFSGMSPERKSRFFREENGLRYRVCPELRSMVVFAPHNVISDPPFTKMDLVSCRNMLIYLLPVAQEKAISLFHFALKVGGILFMGSSESPGALAPEFDVIDSKNKIFKKMRDVKLNLDLRLSSPGEKFKRGNVPVTSTAGMDRNLLRDYDLLLKKYMPTGLIVGERREVLHFFGDVSRYLTNIAGRAERDVIDMVEGDLKLALGAALHRAASENTRIVFKHVKIAMQGGHELVDLAVECLTDDKLTQRHYHVTFLPPSSITVSAIENEKCGTETAFLPTDEVWRRIAELEGDLQTTRENLQATIEELQTTNEELQATNEEMLAANEELQSTNEELHSVNEELYTVNAEFEKKNKELRELNEDHDNLLRSTEVGTLFLDDKLCIRKFNPAITKSFKLLPHDVGRPVDHIAYQFSGQAEMLQDLRDVLSTGNMIEREIQANDEEWLLQRVLPFKSDSGIKGVVLTFTDISKIKAFELERNKAKLLKELASSVPGMVFQYASSPVGTSGFTFISDGASSLLGSELASELITASRMSCMVYEADLVNFDQALIEATNSNSILDCEHRVKSEGDNEKWLHTRCTPKTLHDGTVFWNGVSVDITERKIAAAQVSKAAEFYLTILNRAPALIWRAGLDAKCDWFNATWLSFTGRDISQELGDGWADGVHPEDLQHCLDTYKKSFIARQFFEMEYRMRRHDGEYRWIVDFGCPFKNINGEFGGYIGFCYDITDRRQATLDLELARFNAEEANRTKSEFLANMSHEIRTPLNGVLGMLQLLQSTSLDVEQKEYSIAAVDSCIRLTRLLSDILDLSRVEAGKLGIQAVPFDLSETVNVVNELFKTQAIESGITLDFHIDQDIPKRLIGDAPRLQQVLCNLVGNALKFTHAGKIAVSSHLLPSSDPKRISLMFSISDTGIGIPHDKIDLLFTPFTQVSEGYTRRHQGAGLGLSICKHLVTLMGGNISISSVLGQGTTVNFSANFDFNEYCPIDNSPDLTRSQNLKMTFNILLAEDDNVNRLVAQRMLEKAGCTITLVENGRQAIEALRVGSFDAILMDVQMPVMDGVAATTAIRNGEAGKEHTRIPIIAMTAYTMSGDREKFLASGMDGYISKPLEISNLLEVLKRALDPVS